MKSIKQKCAHFKSDFLQKYDISIFSVTKIIAKLSQISMKNVKKVL